MPITGNCDNCNLFSTWLEYIPGTNELECVRCREQRLDTSEAQDSSISPRRPSSPSGWMAGVGAVPPGSPVGRGVDFERTSGGWPWSSSPTFDSRSPRRWSPDFVSDSPRRPPVTPPRPAESSTDASRLLEAKPPELPGDIKPRNALSLLPPHPVPSAQPHVPFVPVSAPTSAVPNQTHRDHFWTFEKIVDDARNYPNFSAWRTSASYKAALRMRRQKDVSDQVWGAQVGRRIGGRRIGSSHRHWTFEEIVEDARKYPNFTAWHSSASCRTAYQMKRQKEVSELVWGGLKRRLDE